MGNHSNETGLVRKSLQPAARAATRSLWRDDAVRATMMTDERYGEFSDRDSEVVDEAAEGMDFSDSVGPSSVEAGDRGGKPAAALAFSNRLISLVA